VNREEIRVRTAKHLLGLNSDVDLPPQAGTPPAHDVPDFLRDREPASPRWRRLLAREVSAGEPVNPPDTVADIASFGDIPEAEVPDPGAWDSLADDRTNRASAGDSPAWLEAIRAWEAGEQWAERDATAQATLGSDEIAVPAGSGDLSEGDS
jgi:hypothetical protein